MSTKQQFWAGIRAGIPVFIGFVPIAIAYAFMARQAGFSPFETVFLSVVVFAGASQMMMLGMYVQGAGLFALILATFLINLRHLIMGTCIMNRLKSTPTLPKAIAAFGVTDESFAIFSTLEESRCTFPFFVGLVVITYAAWVGGAVVGSVVSGLLPAIVTASCGIALYALFIGLLAPGLSHNARLAALVVLTAVCNTLLCRVMASSWALVLSTLVCAAIGVFFVDPDEQEVTGDAP